MPRLAEFIRATESEIEVTTSWESKLQLASYCYNSTVHTTTGYTPYYLMFGRQARPITGISRPIEAIPDSYLEKFDRNLKIVWGRARENILKKKMQSIDRENAKVKKQKTEDYKIKDKVWVEREVFNGKFNRTLSPWMGPYEVAEVLEFTLGLKKRNRIVSINKGRCKLDVENVEP